MMYRYRTLILDQLAVHGMCPRASTPPALAREQVNDLYLHEIRRLRGRVRAREFPMGEYAARVIELRKRYWLLSRQTDEWLEPLTAT